MSFWITEFKSEFILVLLLPEILLLTLSLSCYVKYCHFS